MFWLCRPSVKSPLTKISIMLCDVHVTSPHLSPNNKELFWGFFLFTVNACTKVDSRYAIPVDD